MKYFLPMLCFAILIIGCGDTTGPEQESYPWQDYQWIPVEGQFSRNCQVSYAVHGDSIYIIGVQEADTSHYCTWNMPDIVSFEILLEGEYPDIYTRDGTRALTSGGSLSTDDWYEYYYPYGLAKESKVFQTNRMLIYLEQTM